MVHFKKVILLGFFLLGGSLSPIKAEELKPEDLSVQEKIQFFEHRIAKTHEKQGGPLTEEQKAHQKAVLDKLKDLIIKADQWDGMTIDQRLQFLNDHNPAIAFRDDQGRIFDKEGIEIKHGHPDYLDIHAVSPRMLRKKRKELFKTGLLTPIERASLEADPQ